MWVHPSVHRIDRAVIYNGKSAGFTSKGIAVNSARLGIIVNQFRFETGCFLTI